MQFELSTLLAPIAAESPCGEDLDASEPLLLASFDAYRLFGQIAPWPRDRQPDWREIRDRSIEALAKSRDLRLLTHLAAAALRTDGLGPFAETIQAAAGWLNAWWDEVYPRVEEDAILRRNALNGLADRIAVIDGLRRTPLLVHRQLGSFCIRDIEIVQGQLAAAEGEEPRDPSELDAILAALETETLSSIAAQLRGAAEGLRAVEATMRDRGGSEAAPDFAAPMKLLARTLSLLDAQLAARAPTDASDDSAQATDGPHVASAARAPGAIGTRDDAVRALDAVAAYFRANEPSSPVPLFIERAKRLVGRDFLAVLEDVVPDSLAQAKSVGGIRDAE